MAQQDNRIIFRNASSSPLGRVTLAGFIRNSPGLSDYRIFNQYALVYLLDGSGRYQDANGMNRRIGPGDIILVFPDVPHRYGPSRSEHWSEFYLCFDGPLFDLWRHHGILDSRNPLYHLEPVHEWLHRFESILGASRKGGFTSPLNEICKLQQLLADIVLGGQDRLKQRDDIDWISRACALLEADRTGRVDLPGLAQTLGMGYESFRKRFIRLVGQPPARYRMARLMDRACELMQHGRWTDKEIADNLGFCDEFYFSRRFKQIVGQSPRQFRQRVPSYSQNTARNINI